MAETYNISATQGSSLSLTITANDSNGVPINLSGYSLAGKVKHKYSDSNALLSLSPVAQEPYASGIMTVNLTYEETEVLPIGRFLYDIEITSGDYCLKVIKGYFDVGPEVTRDSDTIITYPVAGDGTSPVTFNQQIYYGEGAPTITPDQPSLAAIYYDTLTYQVYFWDVDAQSW